MESYKSISRGSVVSFSDEISKQYGYHFVNGTQLGQPQTVTIPLATNNIEFGRWVPDNESDKCKYR